MAKACKKCDPHEICEECPEWIFTLADLIMCMMGLFVVLWVLKTEGEKKQPAAMSQETVNFIAGMREAFGYIPDPNSTDPIDQAILRQTKGPGERGRTNVTPEGAQGTENEVTSIRSSSESVRGGRVLFSASDAELNPQAIIQLDTIVEKIRGVRNIVYIKGHASLDDFPDDADPKIKLDISLRRAQIVADYLVSQGVSPDVMRVIGCSNFEPVQQRTYTAAGHALNRRVEIEATDLLVEQLQDKDKVALPIELESKGDRPTGGR